MIAPSTPPAAETPPPRTLIFVPTYNEQGNAERMCEELFALKLDADILFVDDHSPDGTGQLLEDLKSRHPRLIVRHRAGKLGIGSAHAEALEWAYDQGYHRVVSLDCDFTHSPSDIPALLKCLETHSIAVGSRWIQANSLPGWNWFRRLMTNGGHWLTRYVLGVPQDASGAFRAYRLDQLPREIFRLVRSKGYAFFFESLFILNRNRIAIAEIPIVLPARTYGSSKMTSRAAIRSGLHIFELWLANLCRPEQFLIARQAPVIDPALADPQDWDSYWRPASYRPEQVYEGNWYELIAGLYRRGVIKRELNRAILREFSDGARLLHAGCGSGQVDVDLQTRMNLTALDISAGALHRYSRNNPSAKAIRHGSIFTLPFSAAAFDGVYNLGVMEHFQPEEITRILAEFHRVLRPGGKVVLFWPHARSTSCFALRLIHGFRQRVLGKPLKLHPAEWSLMHSRTEARAILERAGFKLAGYHFGIRDFWVQAVIVGEK